jgi:hypothetical protein
VWWIAKKVGWVFDLQHGGGIESVTIDVSYASIENISIIKGRPNGYIHSKRGQ